MTRPRHPSRARRALLLIPLLAPLLRAQTLQNLETFDLPLDEISVDADGSPGCTIQGNHCQDTGNGILSWTFSGGIFKYTLDTLKLNGLSGAGTFKVELVAPATGENRGNKILFNPTPEFRVTQSYDAVLKVRAVVAHTSLRSPDCENGTATSFTCLVDSVDIDTTGRAYLDTDMYISLSGISSGVIRLRSYYRLNSTCSGVDFDHIEVVQAIQDVNNSVPLIAGKPTVARLFLKIVDPPQPPVAGVTAVLHGFLDGNEASSSPIRPYNSALKVQNVNRRDDESGSLNFDLPADWITGGQLRLQAEATIPPCTSRPDPLTITGSASVDLGSALKSGRENFRVGWVPYCLYGPDQCPKEEFISSYDYLARKLYPVSPAQFQFEKVNIPMPPPWSQNIQADFGSAFKAALNKLYNVSEARWFDQLVGIVRTGSGNTLFGTSDPYFSSFFGKGRVIVLLQSKLENAGLPLSDVNNPTYFNAATLAHEMAHNLGRRHPAKPHSSGRNCGGPDSGSDWPYQTSDTQEVGFDPETRKVIPANDGDYMSYCDTQGVQDWTSPFTYSQLSTSHLQPQSFGFSLAPGRPSQQQALAGISMRAAASASSAQVVLSGWVQKDGSAGALDPVYTVVSSDTPPSSLQNGSHCLRFFGSGGPISDFCFSLAFVDPELSQPLDKEYFSWKIPLPAGVTRIALMTGGNEITALTATSAPPSLTIASPQTGDQWNGGMRTISWSASDPDGKPLVFTVLYSSDGGQSWLPAAIDITDSQFTFDVAHIDGGKNVMFRVMASDGLNSTSADVGPVEVVQIPAMQLDMTTVDFGNQLVGQMPVRTITISNGGSGPLSVASLATGNAAFRVLSPQAPFTVQAGATRLVTIQWVVDVPGPQSTTLHIVPAGTQVQDVTLQGSGFTTPVPNMGVTPAFLDFGSVNSSQSVDEKVTITNTGSAPLNVKLSITGSFSVSPSVIPPIAAADIATLTVTFRPTTSGPQQGILTISGDDPSHPQIQVKLTGTVAVTGVPKIAVSTTTLNFGTVTVGQTADMTLSVSSTGTSPLTLSSLVLSNSTFTLVAPPQLPYTVGDAALQLRIRFTPASAGAQSGTLTIASNDPSSPSVAISLNGSGSSGSVGGTCVAPPANLVSWWTGDGNANDSAGGNDGVLQGGASIGSGEAGQAFQFDGNNGYVSIGNPANLRFTSAITIEAWINPRSAPATGNMQAVLTKWAQIFNDTADSDSYGLWFRNDSKAGLSLFGAIHQAGGREPQVVGGTIPLNAWTHVAMTFDSGTGQLVAYVNGQVVSTSVSPGAIIATSRNVLIGREDSFLPRAFNGLIDEVSVYGRALSGTEIQAIYSAGSLGKCKPATNACAAPPPNIVSWWPGEGNANDPTGGNNGTIQGGASFAAGKVGQAFQFDGNTGYVSMGNPANLRFTNAVTIEAWIYPRAAPASGTMAAVLTKWGQKFDATPDSDSYGLWLRNNGGTFVMFTALHQAGTNEPNIQGGTIALNAWSHVAMSFDSATGQFALYVNGELAGSATTPGAITPTSRNVLIGREDSFLPRPFNGLIDEVSVYGRALSGSEIRAIYSAGSLGKCKPDAH